MGDGQSGNSSKLGALWRTSLPTKIFIGLVLGAVVGISANLISQVPPDAPNASSLDANANGFSDRLEWWAKDVADPLGRVFLRLVMMVVLPLVLSALILGIIGLGDISRLGRVGIRSLVFTVLFSAIAVFIGIGLTNLIGPGKSLSAEKRESLKATYGKDASEKIDSANKAKPLQQVLLDLLPENPLQEMVGAIDGSSKGNGMLSVMCFALIFGIALSVVPEERRAPLVAVLEAVFDATMVVIGFAMRLAPFAVACLMFSMTARLGGDILWTLVWFVASVILGLGLQMFVIYPLALWQFAGRDPVSFFRAIRVAMLTAFGTSSSNATLPTALQVAQENLSIPPGIARFILTVGATANQNGTALYEGVVVLFLAQVFGVELTVMQQVTVVLMSVLAGVGTAGVPGGSIPMIVVVLQSVGVPADGIAIILGVDRLLDMCRTTLNVTGDLVLATCVAASGDLSVQSTAAGPD